MSFGSDFKGWEKLTYQCVRPGCGLVFSGEKLAQRGQIKCPRCGYKIIKKTRPPVVKRVKCV